MKKMKKFLKNFLHNICEGQLVFEHFQRNMTGLRMEVPPVTILIVNLIFLWIVDLIYLKKLLVMSSGKMQRKRNMMLS